MPKEAVNVVSGFQKITAYTVPAGISFSYNTQRASYNTQRVSVSNACDDIH